MRQCLTFSESLADSYLLLYRKENIEHFDDPFLEVKRGALPTGNLNTPRHHNRPPTIAPLSPERGRDGISAPRSIQKTPGKIQILRSRRIVQSSSSEDSDNESGRRHGGRDISPLSDSSPEQPTSKIPIPEPLKTPKVAQIKPVAPSPKESLPLYVDQDGPQIDDGAILTL